MKANALVRWRYTAEPWQRIPLIPLAASTTSDRHAAQMRAARAAMKERMQQLAADTTLGGEPSLDCLGYWPLGRILIFPGKVNRSSFRSLFIWTESA
jgi:hypothetical protein